MALLNFSQTYAGIKDKIGKDGYLQDTDLLFTKDGHIVTHGVDYIPWGNGTIPIEKLPIADKDTHNDKTLWTSETINNLISNSFLANAAMRFKGSIGRNSSNQYTVNGVVSAFPKGEVGDTYRVATAGSYEGNTCEIGDLLICYESGTTVDEDKWIVIQTNINGYSTYKVNGTPYYFYTTSPDSTFDIYAPTSKGTAGNILIWDSANDQPIWADKDTVGIGKYLKAGNGLQIGTDTTGYNGSADKTISLVTATTGSIGGVIIDSDGTTLNGKPTQVGDNQAVLNGATISISDGGIIYLTKQNIINALGYAPEGKGAVSETWRPIKVNNTAFLDNSATGNALDLVSANSTIIITSSTDNSGIVSFDVNLGYDVTKDTITNGLKRVAVSAGEGTNLGKLYVEIPEYDVVSNEINGLAPKIVTTETNQINPNYYILASQNGTKASWYKLNISEINTWRPISVNSNDIGDKKFSIIESDNIYVGVNQNSDSDTYEIGFELQWKEWTN